MKKVVDGTETVFHYAQGGKMIAESEAAGGVTAEYVSCIVFAHAYEKGLKEILGEGPFIKRQKEVCNCCY